MENEENCTIHSDIILVNVFKWLSTKDLVTCSLVCHSWKRVSEDITLWTNIDLSQFRKRLNESRICKFLLDKGSPKVLSLDLSQLSITPKIFSVLKSTCPNLKYLNLQQCCFDKFVRCDDGSVEFNDIPDRLQLLNIRHTHDHPILQSISYKLQPILYLAITNSFLLNIAEWEFFQTAKNLRVLDISHCSTAEDDIFNHIAKACHQLQSLSIRHCSNIYGEELYQILENCKQLRSLYIVGTNIDDLALKNFDLSRCKLEELEISWCKNVRSSGLRALLSKRSSLKFLRLCSNMFGGAIDSDVATSMYFRHPKLKILDISYAFNLQNDDVIKLIETLPKLRYLRLTCCRNLTSDVLSLIPKRVKVHATFNSPLQEEQYFMVPTHDQIFRTIASNSFIPSLYPEESTTEHFKERSFERMLKKYLKK